MTKRRILSRLALAVAAVALIGAAACGDDDEPSGNETPSTESSGTDDGDDSETTDPADEGETTEPETTSETVIPVEDDLSSRLPDLVGYTRADGDDTFSTARCGGGEYAVLPASQASATYHDDDAGDAQGLDVLIAALQFESAEDTETFYGEVTETAEQCVDEGEEITGSDPLELGDEAVIYTAERGDVPSRGIALVRNGEELWLLVAPSPDSGDVVDPDLLDALEGAVDG